MDPKPLEWLDAIPALISFIDSSRCYRMCNRAYYAWFGLSQDQVVGRTMAEVLGEAAWQRLQPHVDAVLAGETRDFEVEVPYRLGGKRWIHAVYTPQRDESGVITGFAVLVSDITKRKHAERELARSEERFRAFVTTSSAIVYRMSPDWGEMRHLDGKDFIADTSDPSRHWLMKYIHPDDQSLVTAAIDKAIRNKSVFELRHRVIRVDGSLGWTFSRAIPLLNEKGGITEWFGAAYDVTEQHQTQDALRESEERYRSLFSSIDEGFCVIEVIFNDAGQPVDYKFIEVNPAFEQHTGMHQPTGKRMGDYVAHIDPVWPERYGRVATTGESLRFAAEFKELNRWFDVYAFRVGDPAKRRVAVIFNNITARKLSDDALRQAKDEAEKASRAKDRFLAQLSHELRTPLTPALMAANALAEDTTLPPAAREQLRMIERNVALEARLIDDLLDLTRITHGKLMLRAEPCDAHQLWRLVAEILHDEASQKHIDVRLELHARHHLVRGDSARLQQVFWNLLRNAVKFTPDGGTVEIRTRDLPAVNSPNPPALGLSNGPAPGSSARPPAASQPGSLGMEITDSGIGLEPGETERIFNAFEQGVAHSAPGSAGLGLGLAIARAVVELHGGSIRAESPGPGRGSTFRIELPGAQPGSADHPRPASRPPMLAGKAPPLRLLLVEDHAPTLKVLARLLEQSGHTVTTAPTMAEAMAAAANSRFDAVLSDLGLPDGSGYELMEHLRDRYGLRGIALSGYGMEDDVRRATEAGFIAHLTKPVNVSDVRHALSQISGKSK